MNDRDELLSLVLDIRHSCPFVAATCSNKNSFQNRGCKQPLIPLVTVATVGLFLSSATVSTVGNGCNGYFSPL